MAEAPLDTAEDSSPESFDGEDEHSQPHTSTAVQWQLQNKTSPSAASSSPSGQPHVVPPMQKRRRVTRACDECRRKKIKCDGTQPCTHCTVYSYDCTYDQPSNRRRNPAPQYIEALEARLQHAETLLRTFIPDYDVKDPKFDALVRQRKTTGHGTMVVKEESHPLNSEALEDSSQDAQIRLMIASTGQLDLDERGDWDFHGGSSGAVFLRRIRQEFGGLLGPDTKMPFLPRPPRPAHTIGSPRSLDSPCGAGVPNTMDLPSQEIALKLCYLALNRGCSLLRFVHGPSFYEMVDRIYNTAPEDFSNAETRFLPLLYVVLALGGMFVDDPHPDHEPEEAIYKASIDQGLKYFRLGRSMMDITDCRDIVSLQAILFMILFLQSSSNLSTCYSYIGVALRSAIRVGLHRNLLGHFNPIERETRRRVFWVMRKMDTYVAALLGFPRLLNDEDIDQELPLEVDDEYITAEAILPMPAGKISVYAASNHHTSLMAILAKIIKYIYPIKGVEESIQSNSSPSYAVSHAKIADIERDLQEWLDKLPMALRPSENGSEELIRVQQLLRIAYAHVQMMLYRPFLHYISPKLLQSKSLDERSYACAATCISVARNVIHITTEMKRRGLLMGAYWFTMYTTFFAILSLAFFVLENPDKAGSEDIMADAIAGKDALRSLAKKSMSADRCNTALNFLFEKLPEKVKRSNTEPKVSRKRRSAATLTPVVLKEATNLANLKSQELSNHVQRASTLPTPLQISATAMQSVSFHSPGFPKSAPADAPYKSFHELIPPMDMSTAATPDSTSSQPLLPPQYTFSPLYSDPSGIPDLSALMFPSADPFAYPNHSMTDFNSRPIKLEGGGECENHESSSAIPNMFLVHGPSPSNPFDSLEGQFFGPLPPYLSQNQGPINLAVGDIHNVSGMDLRGHAGFAPGEALNFDEIFGENLAHEPWNPLSEGQMFMR